MCSKIKIMVGLPGGMAIRVSGNVNVNVAFSWIFIHYLHTVGNFQEHFKYFADRQSIKHVARTRTHRHHHYHHKKVIVVCYNIWVHKCHKHYKQLNIYPKISKFYRCVLDYGTSYTLTIPSAESEKTKYAQLDTDIAGQTSREISSRLNKMVKAALNLIGISYNSYILTLTDLTCSVPNTLYIGLYRTGSIEYPACTLTTTKDIQYCILVSQTECPHTKNYDIFEAKEYFNTKRFFRLFGKHFFISPFIFLYI